MTPSEFIHPEDAAALKQLQSIPGFTALVKKFYAIGAERLQYGMNMANSIRLSERQLPDIYRHLPPICEKFGIKEPEFYLTMNPMPNAWTFGDTKIFVTVTSGLLELLNDDELDAVIAHECGHILCRHVVYHSMAEFLKAGLDAFGILGAFSAPVKYALLYWQRKSELSCDRAGAVFTNPETVAMSMARIAGGPRRYTGEIDLKEWAEQAEEYEKIRTGGAWNKTLQTLATMELDHPFNAVRCREILKWGKTQQYQAIVDGFKRKQSDPGKPKCPHCGGDIEESWKFCLHCGTKLKD